MERLVRMSPPLEANSCYAYVLLCSHFKETCLVARAGFGLAGFVMGYCPPGRADTYFVWQVAVHEGARGLGLGAGMLESVLQRGSLAGVKYLEATVSPDNLASRGLFESFARRQGVACTVEPYFSSALFGTGQHEPEDLFRIGPLNQG